MKKMKILLLFTLIFLIKVKAYIPTLGNSNEWYVIVVAEVIYSITYSIDESETIGNVEYKKLIYNNSSTCLYVREDSLQNKIYVLPEKNKEELVLYDFSLEKNDEIELYGYPFYRGSEINSFGTYTVEKTDSIEIDGSQRKRLVLFKNDNTNIKDVWIESIGSTNNFLSPGKEIYAPGIEGLRCFYKDDQKLYTFFFDENDQNCDYVSSVGSLNILHRCKVYPNPFTNSVTIETQVSGDFKVMVINSLGQVVYSNRFEDTTLLQPDLSHLKKGIYQLVILNGKKVYTKRIVKNE